MDPTLEHISAESAVRLYGKRMQVEEAFRDLKSERFGLGLHASCSKDGKRIGVLLLAATLAAFAGRLIGAAAANRGLARQCQSNTRRSRAVLSVITLGRQVVCTRLAVFTVAELKAALRTVQQSCLAAVF